jgi:hypothetical protein
VSDLQSSPHDHLLKFNLSTFQLDNTDFGLEDSYEPYFYDVSPNGLSAVMAGCYFGALPSSGYSEIGGTGPGGGSCLSATNTDFNYVNNIAFDGQGNLYVLYGLYQSTFGTPVEVADTLITQYPNGASNSRNLPPGSSLGRDPYWNVTLGYTNGTSQVSEQLGQGIQTASLPMGEGDRFAFLPDFFSFLKPSVAWAQGVNPDTPAGASAQMQVNTGDGRIYVLGTDGLTVYGYDTNNNLLCQISIQEGANDPFMGVVISYAPGGGPGGTLAFMDDSANVRVAHGEA